MILSIIEMKMVKCPSRVIIITHKYDALYRKIYMYKYFLMFIKLMNLYFETRSIIFILLAELSIKMNIICQKHFIFMERQKIQLTKPYFCLNLNIISHYCIYYQSY